MLSGGLGSAELMVRLDLEAFSIQNNSVIISDYNTRNAAERLRNIKNIILAVLRIPSSPISKASVGQ